MFRRVVRLYKRYITGETEEVAIGDQHIHEPKSLGAASGVSHELTSGSVAGSKHQATHRHGKLGDGGIGFDS